MLIWSVLMSLGGTPSLQISSSNLLPLLSISHINYTQEKF